MKGVQGHSSRAMGFSVCSGKLCLENTSVRYIILPWIVSLPWIAKVSTTMSVQYVVMWSKSLLERTILRPLVSLHGVTLLFRVYGSLLCVLRCLLYDLYGMIY